MLDHLAVPEFDTFTPPQQRDAVVRDAGGIEIGQSEAGRPILGLVLGHGPLKVSLISGSHSDEPIGSETLRLLIAQLPDTDLLERFTFVILPHTNPDGEHAQRGWLDVWPDPLAILKHRLREPPGRDVEFAYPEGRVENRAVAVFLQQHGPYHLHLSLHGMQTSTGGWHLIERSWVDRTATLREQYAAAMTEAGLGLFDWDRHGDKGFDYLGPGFATTPRSDAMREFFMAEDDPDTAALFGLNSMEYVRTLGGDPLCMVTELPLMLLRSVEPREDPPGVPQTFLDFYQAFRAAKAAMTEGDLDAVFEAVGGYELTPIDLAVAVRLQLKAIGLGMAAVTPTP